MPLTQYYTATSLDGYIADEHNSLDWLFQFDDGSGNDSGDETDADSLFRYERFIADIGAIAMGSTTYRWVQDHLAGSGERWPYQQPTWVFSHRDQQPIDGADLRFVSGEVAPIHAEMTAAAGGKNIWVVGGGDLVGQFHDAGLLDELILTVAAVTLGAGAPLLPRRISTPPLQLVAAQMTGPFASLQYRVQRPVAAASDQPAG